MTMASYSKHFIPLESDPDVFNELMHLLGVPPSLRFEDVWTLDGPHALAGPALALVLVLPTTESYERRKAVEDAEGDDTDGEHGEHVVWYPQTINNACGLYAILHALSNGAARDVLLGGRGPDSRMAALIEACSSLPPNQRCSVLENSAELEDAYATVARKGSSQVPDSAEDEVDFHYVCLVRSRGNGRLYELDGDRPGPVDRGPVVGPGEDLLAPGAGAVDVVRAYIEHEGGNANFSLMALVHCGGG